MINVRLKQSNHNHNHNNNLMGFDTIEINLVVLKGTFHKKDLLAKKMLPFLI